MMENTFARKIGYKQAFKAVTIGLIIAYIIMALLGGPLWLFQFGYPLTILLSVAIIYAAGYFIGGFVGIWIFKNKLPPVVAGVLGGFLIVWSATLGGSLVGFVNEGLPNEETFRDAFYDYIYKPVGLVTMFGLIPIIVVGIWFGLSIKTRIRNTLSGQT